MTDKETTYAAVDDLAGDDAYEVTELDVKLSRGRTVRVRGLSRLELINSSKGTEDNAEIERRTMIHGMINPKMSDSQIKAWQGRPGSIVDVGLVVAKIRDLSGLGKGADKSKLAQISE